MRLPCCAKQFEPSQVAASPTAFASRAFPVVQQDKVRRADDWTRSGRNSTVFVLTALRR